MRALPPIALLALVLLGCRSSSAPDRARASSDPTVALPGDPEVESRLETLNARTDESGGRALLRMDLRNKSASSLAFAWSVEWFDRSGSLVGGSARVWTPMKLAGGATRSIEIPVPSPDAKSWRLRAARSG